MQTPTDPNIMNFNTQHIQQRLTQFFSKLFFLTVIWAGFTFGGNPALAQPLDLKVASPVLATSASSMSKQVSGKADQMKGSAKQAVGKAQSAMEDNNKAIKAKVKDDLTEAKVVVDSSATRAKNGIEKTVDSAKGFFGK
jgi:uncharacterized protein YjbJ (UPF0337 family)